MKSYEIAPEGAVKRARQLRRDPTDAERRLWRALRSKLPQYKWRRQMPIGAYFADFVCFAERLIIEVDGGQHASAADYDAKRTRFLEAEGFRVIRFWNNEVLRNTDGVLKRIAADFASVQT
jgi:very-short-patch-repair endonuclease